jgi:hypothetical protein
VRTRIVASTIVGTLATLLLAVPGANADGTEPWGDKATGKIANRLDGTHRGGWLATTLGYGCDVTYNGPRKAEIVRIPAGHGRRWVGIIHVTKPKQARRVHAALVCKAWFARSGGRLVLPLRSSTWTDGGVGATYKEAAIWAKRRLGAGWKVH